MNAITTLVFAWANAIIYHVGYKTGNVRQVITNGAIVYFSDYHLRVLWRVDSHFGMRDLRQHETYVFLIHMTGFAINALDFSKGFNVST